MNLNKNNAELINSTNTENFIFELVRYDKTSKIISLKKNKTLASLYYNAESIFGHKCKLYIVDNEKKMKLCY